MLNTEAAATTALHALDLQAEDGDWLQQLVTNVGGMLRTGPDVAGVLYVADPRDHLHVLAGRALGRASPTASALAGRLARLAREDVASLLSAPTVIACDGHARVPGRAGEFLLEVCGLAPQHGEHRTACVVNVASPPDASGKDQRCVMVVLPLPPHGLDSAFSETLHAVAGFVARALRLRGLLRPAGMAPFPGSPLEQAALREAVRAVDAVHDTFPQTPLGTPLAWALLEAGACQAVDRFEEDGRRFHVFLRAAPPRSLLTPRERQVVQAVGRGLSNHEAGVNLGVAASSVATLLRRACRKLNLRSRLELVQLVARLGPPPMTPGPGGHGVRRRTPRSFSE